MPHDPPTGDLLLESRSDILDLIEHLAAASAQLILAYRANDQDNTKQATTSLCNATDLLDEIKNKAIQWRHWAAQSIRDNK